MHPPGVSSGSYDGMIMLVSSTADRKLSSSFVVGSCSSPFLVIFGNELSTNLVIFAFCGC